jgi:mRNA interferase MazF
VIERGRVCTLEAGKNRRAVLVVQSDAFNRSRIPTVVVVPLSQRTELARAPGNVLIPARASGLLGDTVALVSSVQSVERDILRESAAAVSGHLLDAVDHGLRQVLGM